MKRKNFIASLIAFVLAISLSPLMFSANAQLNGVTIDFAASEPTSYSHLTGGGVWGDGRVNTDITRSLTGEQFACRDKVSYLTKVSVGNTPQLQSFGAMTFELRYLFDLDSTGQSGVALSEPVIAEITTGDSSNINDGGSEVTIVEISPTGPIFSSNAKLGVKLNLTDVEANESIVIRLTLEIHCQPGSRPTGNLQAKFDGGSMILKNGSEPQNPVEAINVGAKTIDLKSLGDLSYPELVLTKTVTTASGTCPGNKTMTIEPDETVKYCYEVTNTSNSGGQLGATAYNLTAIFDDSGQYPDFTVDLVTGLSDVDGDGQVDDLAPGAVATGSYLVAFDGDKDSTVINIATVTGYDAPVAGNPITATDSATVFIDAPELVPAISISKLTNGVETPTVLAGSTVIWTYLVTNTGNAPLTGISVVDNMEALVSCPETSLAVAGQMTCSASGTAIIGNYSNIGTASGSYETQTVTASDSSGYFGANPKISILKGPKTQLVIEGDTATFTIAVTNTGNVDLTNISVLDALAPNCNRSDTSLATGASINYTCDRSAVMSPFVNEAVASANWESVTVTASDTASVLVDFLPKISVTKTASVESVPESGGFVTYTVVITNQGVDTVTVVSLIDDRFGNLDGVGTCQTPEVISVGGSYSCSFTKLIKSETLTAHVNVVTAIGEDPTKNQTSAFDDASVAFTDVMPDVAISKVANPTAANWSGDYVDYTLVITNVGAEGFIIYSLVDNKFALSGDCLSLIGQYLAPGGTLQCQLLDQYVSGDAGGSFVNTATVIGMDNESNMDTATASATVNFWWYGRTPGYWKNHPGAWPSGYAPGDLVQNVFAVPSTLKSGGNLDLNKDGKADTLIDGLSYKGGSALQGGAQILMRAAIAALLNEAYYGAGFPIASSTSELITQINQTLATQSRSQYVSFASYLDYWNNAVHASLP